ncbi:MAG: hypothetical protein ACHQUC_02775 [Chlamydiales bacterium]
MQMKINEKILSIPPYISTTWSQIAALRMKGSVLSITMTDGEAINISGLSHDLINQVFSYHAAYLEKEILPSSQASYPPAKKGSKEGVGSLGESATLNFAFGTMDGLNMMAQHNSAQADAPDLPPEVLQNISEIARAALPLGDLQLPKPEADCNCFYCQIARAINPSAAVIELREQHDEEVTDDELRFEQWSITQAGEKLYNVTSRLDNNEKYSVFLGHPVGCTCGKNGCEHILAVLKS